MRYEEIDWPASSWRGDSPEPDPELVSALLHTLATGRAIKLKSTATSSGSRGPAQGHLYRLGYNVHQRTIGQNLHAVRVTAARVVCDKCGDVTNMVSYCGTGKTRLRQRDECLSATCDGRIQRLVDAEEVGA